MIAKSNSYYTERGVEDAMLNTNRLLVYYSILISSRPNLELDKRIPDIERVLQHQLEHELIVEHADRVHSYPPCRGLDIARALERGVLSVKHRLLRNPYN